MDVDRCQAQVVWRKSSRSDGLDDNCVEVAFGAGVVAIRDSNVPDEVVRFEPNDWKEFIRLVSLRS